MEPAGPRKVGIKGAAGKSGGVHIQIGGPACDADIAEPEIGEMRAERAARPVPDNGEAGVRRPQVSAVEFTLLQNLPELQRDFAAMGKGGGKLNPSREILAKIQHGLPGRSVQDLPYDQTLLQGQPGAVPSDQVVCPKGEDLCPGCFRRGGIVLVFPIVDSAVEDFGEPACPALVGADRLLAAIRVDDLKLSEGGKTLAPAVFGWREPEPSLVPAIPQQDLHAVVRLQKMRQIKGKHLRGLGVCIEKRGKYILTQLFPVQIGLEQSVAGDMERGRSHWF